MGVRTWIEGWPVYRQLTGPDPLGRGAAAMSQRSADLTPRTADADGVARSVCPYCAVGCGQLVFHKDGKVTQIEGDPDSPISRGRLCPKGSASKNLVTSPLRQKHVLYRPPHGTEWQRLDLDTAMEMIADRVVATRARDLGGQGRPRSAAASHDGDRQPRRRDAGQRGELPHQEAVHGARRSADREPGPYLTLRHGSRSGSLVRSRRRHQLPAGHRQRGLCRHPGLEHGRGPPRGLPVGDGGQGARREGDPCRPAVHAYVSDGRHLRPAARRVGHRLPRRHHQPRPAERAGLP